MAMARTDGFVSLRDAETNRESELFLAHFGPVISLSYGADGTLLSTGWDGSVAIWRDQSLIKRLRHSAHPVLAAAFSADQRMIASCGMDQTTRLWSWPEGKV